MSRIRVEDAKKDFLLGKTVVQALRGVSLSVAEGEFLAIAGPSGSGKTTLLNLISGIEKPSSGKIFIEETELSELSPNALADIRAEKIGFIFQNFNLLPVLTAFENIEYPLLLAKKVSTENKRERVSKALCLVGLERFSNHKPMELSGGQRQRVAIARAIVTEPSVVLADEPTANLDHQTGEGILKLMKKINQELKTTFIFSTHDQKIMDMADHIVNLLDGEVIN